MCSAGPTKLTERRLYVTSFLRFFSWLPARAASGFVLFFVHVLLVLLVAHHSAWVGVLPTAQEKAAMADVGETANIQYAYIYIYLHIGLSMDARRGGKRRDTMTEHRSATVIMVQIEVSYLHTP